MLICKDAHLPNSVESESACQILRKLNFSPNKNQRLQHQFPKHCVCVKTKDEIIVQKIKYNFKYIFGRNSRVGFFSSN